jgi:hypothetical protein
MLTHYIDPPPFYSFHPDTGEYVGSGICDLSPARYGRKDGPVAGHLKEPNLPLVPGYATLVVPPEAGEHEVPVWFEDHWELISDYRGEVRWNGEEFVTVTGLGDPRAVPLQVHDAQYVLPPNDDPGGARIRVWVNDSVIENDQNQLPRKVVAAWEAQGETIRPIAAPETEPLPADAEPINLTALEEKVDALAAKAVEG